MIKLNFLPFERQDFSISIFRKLHESNERDANKFYHNFSDNLGNKNLYEIEFQSVDGFEEYELQTNNDIVLIAKSLYYKIIDALPSNQFLIKNSSIKNRKIHFILENHPKGEKTVWIEPYFLKARNLWGILLDFHFIVRKENEDNITLDKDILMASGSLNNAGNVNLDYYLFKHKQITSFIKRYLSKVSSVLNIPLDHNFLEINSSQLASKNYVFGNGNVSTSPYLGLVKNEPLKRLNPSVQFYFIYKRENREAAVALLRGLRGESYPTTFGGMQKLFSVKFDNEVIKGSAIDDFTDELLDVEIQKIRSLGDSVIPIIITNAKKDEDDDRIYYWLKHKFTNLGIPCQVVTKDLIANDNSLKYSLSNIALQIFSKAGGMPWKMKSLNQEYLIIGIGQSYNLEYEEGSKVEKNITYSILTDSSGLFKDIQVLGEGIEDDNYYSQLVKNISSIINTSSYKKILIHCPFRISKKKILEKVVANVSSDLELSVLVINNKSDFFGFDYSNNGLVPFESTYIKLAQNDFLVWFEGLQYNNPKITKRFGNPVLIVFWYTNKLEFYNNTSYKESLLQDCINLSGANWRGFKAKQLPVSVFYCQRIAEFIAKFKDYNFSHIEINNLKPWFL